MSTWAGDDVEAAKKWLEASPFSHDPSAVRSLVDSWLAKIRRQRKTMCYSIGKMTELRTPPILSLLIYSALRPSKPVSSSGCSMTIARHISCEPGFVGGRQSGRQFGDVGLHLPGPAR